MKFEKSWVVIYKNAPALVGEQNGDKFTVAYCTYWGKPKGKKNNYAEQKVREKDVVLLCAKAASSIDKILETADSFADENSEPGKTLRKQIDEIYELLQSDGETKNKKIAFSELTELLRGDVKADESWGVYETLKNGFEFEENIEDGEVYFAPRSEDEIKSLKDKVFEKEHAEEIRAEFIKRLKAKTLLPEDAKFMGDEIGRAHV